MRSTRKCRAQEVCAGEIERARHLFTFRINPCPDSALYVDASPLSDAGTESLHSLVAHLVIKSDSS